MPRIKGHDQTGEKAIPKRPDATGEREVATERARATGERLTSAMNGTAAVRPARTLLSDRIAVRLVTRRGQRQRHDAGSRDEGSRHEAADDLREAVHDAFADERHLSPAAQIENKDRRAARADRAQQRGAPPGIV